MPKIENRKIARTIINLLKVIEYAQDMHDNAFGINQNKAMDHIAKAREVADNLMRGA